MQRKSQLVGIIAFLAVVAMLVVPFFRTAHSAQAKTYTWGQIKEMYKSAPTDTIPPPPPPPPKQ